MPYLTSLVIPVSTVTTGFNTSRTNTTSFSGSIIAKRSGGFLLTLTGYTSATYTQYIQVYDQNTFPPTGRPVSVNIIPSQANFNLTFEQGLPLSNGILIVTSNTPVAYTSGGDTTYFTVVYK